MPKMIRKRKNIDDQSIKIVFDVDMVEALIKYIRCDHVSQPQKMAVCKLMDILDFNQYQYNQDILDRLRLLKVTSKGICEEHIVDESILLSYIRNELENADDIIKSVDFEKNKINTSEAKIMNKFINEKLQCVYIYQEKDEIIKELQSFDTVGFTSYYEAINNLKEKLSKLLVKLQNISSPDEMIRSFNFSGDNYLDLLRVIVNRSKKPTTVLQTGIRQFNALLAPGFQGGRLYTILGGTGRFKSGTLWNITDQIRQFNPQIIPVENGMRKVLLFVTMENTIYETIIRLIDMYNPTAKEVKEMEVEEVAEILRSEGHFIFTSDSGIDIEMRYFADLEIATSSIYTIIRELADQGKQVIALILDYILKLNSDNDHHGDERARISLAGRELKALAQYYDIPVITAMQINREGNNILESTMEDNKEDVGRFIGNSYVGQCWDLIQTSDWVCFINLEMQKSTGKWFLSVKCTKQRGKRDPFAVTYFNHPFHNNNGIRLEPDVNKPEPISVISLASDLVSIDDSNMDGSARKRPKANDKQEKPKYSASTVEVDMEDLLKAS